MTDLSGPMRGWTNGAELGVPALGTASSLAALFSAMACCVLPLALGAVGVTFGGLATLVPYRWPLTIVALLAVAGGWVLYLRKRRACAAGGGCAEAPGKATLVMLGLATVMAGISALWDFIEQPLMRALGGA